MFTNIRSRSLALAAVSVAVGLGSHQALATVGTGHANASIVSAISLHEDTQLNFGFVVPSSSTTGTVALTAAGVPSVTGGVVVLNGSVPGQWTATGTTGQPAVVQVDATTETLTSSGGATMTADAWTTDATGASTFAAGNTFTFHIGATLHVAANQAPGNYSGTYTVTVNY